MWWLRLHGSVARCLWCGMPFGGAAPGRTTGGKGGGEGPPPPHPPPLKIGPNFVPAFGQSTIFFGADGANWFRPNIFFGAIGASKNSAPLGGGGWPPPPPPLKGALAALGLMSCLLGLWCILLASRMSAVPPLPGQRARSFATPMRGGGGGDPPPPLLLGYKGWAHQQHCGTSEIVQKSDLTRNLGKSGSPPFSSQNSVRNQRPWEKK